MVSLNEALLASLKLTRLFPGIRVRFFQNEGLLKFASTPKHLLLWKADGGRRLEVTFSKRDYEWAQYKEVRKSNFREFPIRPFPNAVLIWASYYEFDLVGTGSLFDQIMKADPSSHFSQMLLDKDLSTYDQEKSGLDWVSSPISWGYKALGAELMDNMKKVCLQALIHHNLGHRRKRHETASVINVEQFCEDFASYANMFTDVALITCSNDDDQIRRMLDPYIQGNGEDFIYVVQKVCRFYDMMIKDRFNEETLLSFLRQRDPYFSRS